MHSVQRLHPTPEATSSTAGQGAALQMVAAQATLVKGIDAREARPGQDLQSVPQPNKVQLKNGPELPRGTELIGTVTDDQMQMKGRLAPGASFYSGETEGW